MQEIKRRNVAKEKDPIENKNVLKEEKLKSKKEWVRFIYFIKLYYAVIIFKTVQDYLFDSRSSSRNISLRVLSRTVVIFSLLIIVYFSSKDEKIKVFAKQSDKLPGVGQIVDCSASYMKEVDKYEGCFPKNCKRFVTDTVISDNEADKLLAIAKKGLKHGGSSGGASILDLHSGAMSKGQHFVNFYKINELKNVFDDSDFNVYRVRLLFGYFLLSIHNPRQKTYTIFNNLLCFVLSVSLSNFCSYHFS